MKPLIKYLYYALLMVGIIITSLSIFKDHPEAQFAFIFPGVFLLVFSEFLDHAFSSASRLKALRGR